MDLASALMSTLSATPLGRRHRRELDGASTRRNKVVPFEAFRGQNYAAPALELAHDLFSKLTIGEYSAIGLFSQIAAGLAFSGAPLELITAATRASADEARHVEYCRSMAACCGAVPSFDCREVVLGSSIDCFDLAALDLAILQYSALGETLAMALLNACRAQAKDPVTRAFFTTLVADEVHHARLGWYYAAYRAPSWTLSERQQLADRLAEILVGIEQEYFLGRDAPRGCEADARSLGVLDSPTQRACIAEVVEQEILPALDHLGFNGSQAWALRARGK